MLHYRWGLEYRTAYKKHKTYPQFDFDKMSLFAPNDQFLSAPPAAPSRKRFQRPRDDVDEFLSSDLELSFASTMSLHSPPHVSTIHTPNNDLMDVSPTLANPVFTLARPKDDDAAKPKSRPRAFTSGARTFGRDVSNSVPPALQPPLILQSSGSTSNKRTQRSALPFEWMAAPPVENVHSKNMFAVSILNLDMDWSSFCHEVS